MNILLIGLRGCGKSTVGRLVARRLERPFVDLDEQVLGTFPEATVWAVWSARGEPAWRDAEARAVDDVLEGSGVVVALGGGTPMIDAARQRLEREQRQGRAVIVYLRCATAQLAQRLAADGGDRPSLTGAGTVAEIETVLADREPVFRRLADFECDVTDVTTEQAASAVVQLVGGAGGAEGLRRG